MKSILSIARRAALAFFAALTLILVFGAAMTARAQQLTPFVDCVERVDNANYRVYFGYFSTSVNNIEIGPDGPGNFFTPIFDIPGHPSIFLPGVHHRVVAVTVPNATNETWVLGIETATARAQTLFPCNDAGSNTRTITYQGRLTDGNQAANGQYDLRFQIFNAATGGTAKSATLALENVSVTNGVFTAQLDFGILPAMLDGGNLFLEIGVRAGIATGAYTTLTTRQPLTATPYAIRAQSAANADLLNGATADQFVRLTDERLSDARTPTAGSANYIQNATTQQATSNFNISGSGTIGGSLTVSGAISGNFGQSVTTASGTGVLQVPAAMNDYTLVPGLAQTVNVPANSSLLISTDGGIQSLGAVGSFSLVDIAIFVDGAAVGERRIIISNNPLAGSVGNWTLNIGQTLAAGSHTIEIKTRSGFGGSSTASVSGDNTNPLLKGQLTVAIIKK